MQQNQSNTNAATAGNVAQQSIFCVEYYTPNGEEIRLAWVTASDRDEAVEKCHRFIDDDGNLMDFDEVITVCESSCVERLACEPQNLRHIDTTPAL